MARIAARKDANHDEIKDAFERMGWRTIDTFNSNGTMLDLLIYKFNRPPLFIEVKSKYGELTDREERFIERHPERSRIVRSFEDAINVNYEES